VATGCDSLSLTRAISARSAATSEEDNGFCPTVAVRSRNYATRSNPTDFFGGGFRGARDSPSLYIMDTATSTSVLQRTLRRC